MSVFGRGLGLWSRSSLQRAVAVGGNPSWRPSCRLIRAAGRAAPTAGVPSENLLLFTLRKDVLCRSLCTALSEEVSYEQLKHLLKTKDAVVIDVREPWELKEYGRIPGSINVPLGELGKALQLDPGDFKEKYSGNQPCKSDNIVFSCLAGIRSKTAVNEAMSMGYSRLRSGWKMLKRT
ncbi:thiosulfate sulfurtransferase/rhodanese-like domain-containing protein 3 isoform X2 [Latimeria chalumnae]|uniref:thiosulfate sulfurtransferase/rhodanese-like domain-containing protein 3 isoform X2 n=1 Tax=Latimeria chalumnae TaxID=7897 RepID=UPI00313E1654